MSTVHRSRQLSTMRTVAVHTFAEERDRRPPHVNARPAARRRREEGDDIVARITDPTAPAEQLTVVFQARGLDIHVQTLPVSPSLVGTLVYSDVNSIQDLQTGNCLQGGGGGCWIGLVIPADFTGSGTSP